MPYEVLVDDGDGKGVWIGDMVCGVCIQEDAKELAKRGDLIYYSVEDVMRERDGWGS